MNLREVSKNQLKELPLPEATILQIEKSIYNKSLDQATKNHIQKSWKNSKFVAIYENNFRHIISNLDPNSHVENNYLLNKLKDNPNLADDIANMQMDELFPERWEAHYREKEIREGILNNREIKENSFIRCKKCKSRKVLVNTFQARSADEASTNMKICQDCGYVSKS